MKIFSVLNSDDIDQIKKLIEEGIWKNGKNSALGGAKLNKENKQIAADDKIFEKLMPYLIKVHNDPTVKSYTFLKELIDPRIASYELNEYYDWHVDSTLLANKRTDLSFTIFISDKSEYEGGELVFQISNQLISVKGNSGQMIVYPSGMLHKVNKIQSGKRLVVVGWINSHVKFEEHRERLFQFGYEKTRIEKLLGYEETKNLNQIYYSLIRDFSS